MLPPPTFTSFGSLKQERWNRNCGSGGLGPATHIAGDGYRPGVLEANWVEELSGADMKATGKHILGFGAPMTANSMQRISYTAQGKVGEDLAYISQRHDRQLSNEGQSGDVLFRHGDFLQPRMDAAASLNSLTYGEKQHGEPRVQTYLWDGSNHHSRNVPLKQSNLDLTRSKVSQWQKDSDPYSAFKTSTRTAAMSAALPSAISPSKTATIRPSTEGGQEAQVGRKPVGLNQQECDKNYRHMGLRDTYCTFLTSPKH
ncbi:hypothetical protein CEUSTIGMA_g1036.t1 [Chlamydomonas eustigma]|uniref:Flagellar associated protein n=1 Tax=Chlamydomonas eustigma TaxID=1157962 RepID=A0A250WRW7_9CHLO|nr:hypothetical protein CEUSTIGMA_g1036.t1 [Chlamydomonas eustigma]|eukprot:GAX73585.1 hypothetical protein CEUSTIGMA_g1036.t1 [Chlamydomonas eustigma]